MNLYICNTVVVTVETKVSTVIIAAVVVLLNIYSRRSMQKGWEEMRGRGMAKWGFRDSS